MKKNVNQLLKNKAFYLCLLTSPFLGATEKIGHMELVSTHAHDDQVCFQKFAHEICSILEKINRLNNTFFDAKSSIKLADFCAQCNTQFTELSTILHAIKADLPHHASGAYAPMLQRLIIELETILAMAKGKVTTLSQFVGKKCDLGVLRQIQKAMYEKQRSRISIEKSEIFQELAQFDAALANVIATTFTHMQNIWDSFEKQNYSTQINLFKKRM